VNDELRVHVFTLTQQSKVSEHVYAGELQTALRDRGVRFVDDANDADVVHLFEVNTFTRHALQTFRYPAVVRLLYSSTPVVVSTDDLFFVDRPDLSPHSRIYRLNHYVQRWLLSRADAMIATSESVRDVLRPHLPGQQIEVVHHGVDERYFADPEEKDDEPFVLHVSLAAPRKNPKAIIDISYRLDTKFVIAGSGWPERIPDDVGDNVEVKGYLPERELVDCYKRAGIFYFPTLHEGFGLPVLEAMAARCATVTTDIFSVPEVTGNTAILTDPNDIDSHIEAIHDLMHDDDKRRNLAQRAQNRARTFSWEKAAERIEEVYRSCWTRRDIVSE